MNIERLTMTIKELRKSTGMSQSKFSAYFKIPIQTVRAWEQETRVPPQYLVELIQYKIEKENLKK